MRTWQVGIIGTGFISEWFIESCAKVDGIEPVSIYSRNPASATTFAEKHQLASHFSDLREMLASDLDAVYIASPIYAHRDHAIAALTAGKPVLCEKTLGSNSSELEQMIQASLEHGQVLLEATRPIFDPAWQTIRENLPKLGALRRVTFEKCQYSSRYDAFRSGTILNAFKPELSNSSLGDIGVYCLQPAVQLFGHPRRVWAAATLLHNGMEGSGVILLDHDGFQVECIYSKISTSVTPSLIQGENATMVIDSVDAPAKVQIEFRDGSTETLLDTAPALNMHYEIRAFRDLLEAGHVDHPYLAISRESMAIMDAARRQTGALFPADVTE